MALGHNTAPLAQIVSGLDLSRDHSWYPRGFPGLLRNLMRYYDIHGKLPRTNDPQTFNDKIWFRLLHDRRPVLTLLADKYVVRDYVAAKFDDTILPTLYWVTADPAAIRFESLPNSFIAKANHGSGWTYIVPDKNKANIQQMQMLFGNWINQNYYDRKAEWAYKNIKPKILVEELLTHNNRIPDDYKFYCFDGNVAAVHVVIDRFGLHRKQFYTPDWKAINLEYMDCKEGIPLAKPENFEVMIEVAECLSRPLDFVRVDLYNVNGRIYFGEMTIYPGAGVGKFIRGSLDVQLGHLWTVKLDR